ncbi:MAG: hypothetical protein K5979_07535 [Ruminococcus sp.]|nr:hypothetical protein [Ruminococcus sp.]
MKYYGKLLIDENVPNKRKRVKNMFNNPGKKIKIAAKVYDYLSIIAGGIISIILMSDGGYDAWYIVCVEIGFIANGWFCGLFMYGIGETIENISSIKEDLSVVKKIIRNSEVFEDVFINSTKTSEPKTEGNKRKDVFEEKEAEEKDGWECPCCGEFHETTETSCKCGFTLND